MIITKKFPLTEKLNSKNLQEQIKNLLPEGEEFGMTTNWDDQLIPTELVINYEGSLGEKEFVSLVQSSIATQPKETIFEEEVRVKEEVKGSLSDLIDTIPDEVTKKVIADLYKRIGVELDGKLYSNIELKRDRVTK